LQTQHFVIRTHTSAWDWASF